MPGMMRVLGRGMALLPFTVMDGDAAACGFDDVRDWGTGALDAWCGAGQDPQALEAVEGDRSVGIDLHQRLDAFRVVLVYADLVADLMPGPDESDLCLLQDMADGGESGSGDVGADLIDDAADLTK